MYSKTAPPIGNALLACPKCRAPLPDIEDRLICAGCGMEIRVLDGVVIARPTEAESYFDQTFAVMQEGNRMEGTWEIFYAEQIRYVESLLIPGEVVLDVGCGPTLLYDPKDTYVIGVDASLPSIQANKAVSLGVYASAAELPLRTASVDTVMCFYSIHHMTGANVAENERIVRQVFSEFERVLKPAGRLMIFDMSPWFGFAMAEELVWNMAKAKIGPGLDMFFWKDRRLRDIATLAMKDASLTIKRFGRKPFQTFPPVFSKPGLRLPRFLYPFDINLYSWQRGKR